MSIVEPAVNEIIEERPVVVPQRSAWRRHTLVWTALVLVVGAAIWAGLPVKGSLRHWVFQETRAIRGREDVARGFRWGRQGVDKGFLGLYGSMRGQVPGSAQWIDYPPLRLAALTYWAQINARRFPAVTEYQDTFEFASPVLWADTAVELFGAVGMFLLVRHWVVRHRARRAGAGGEPIGPYTGVTSGVIAALLLWFNPAILLSAYGWGSWDVWIIPFYIWAIYLASVNRWFLAGLTVAVGAMFKGQMLVVAGLFLIWPLVAGWPRTILCMVLAGIVSLGVRLYWLPQPNVAGQLPGAVAGWVFMLCAAGILGLMVWGARWSQLWRWACGFTFGVGLIVSPWMLRDFHTGKLSVLATGWVAATLQWSAAALLAVYCIRRWGMPRVNPDSANIISRLRTWIGPRRELRLAIWSVTILLPVAILLSDWLLSGRFHWRTAILAVVAGAGVIAARSARQRACLLAAVCGGSLLLCMPLFNASDAWYIWSFKFPTRHYNQLVAGSPDNIPAVLAVRYGFDNNGPDYTVFDIPAKTQFGWPDAPLPVTLRMLMKGLFLVAALPCAVAAAVQYRRDDKRFLMAVTAPWLLFFLFPLQMNERYLLFAAGAGACLAAVGLGPTLLHLFLTLASLVMVLNVLEEPSRRGALSPDSLDSIFVRYAEVIRNICAGAYPDFAWALLLVALMFIYLSIAPSKRTQVQASI